ncbi:MAG: hypothetical protein ACE5HF_07505 [Gemmatimonadota bacterium]
MHTASVETDGGVRTAAEYVTWGQFLLITVQLALLLAAAQLFGIEEMTGFERLLPVIFVGFAVHAWLPRRWRLPLFCLLFVVSVQRVMGLTLGLRLVTGALVLIAICHLPLRFRSRVALLLLIGVGLVGLRVGWPRSSWTASLILPVMAGMFMFRLIIYLYDLRHEKTPATLWERLSYFFLFPNVCFPLFPVVDYETFRRTYYATDARAIYEKGLSWIGRGIIHLLLYRAVYYYLVPAPSEVANVGSLALFMLSGYLLYLHISGQFHLIVGALCLFGFDLPETNHKYYLASSFSDLWRRINIYWKDFMMKVFYYPIFFRLRRHGMTRALVIATLFVFMATWLLHSYQWFWLQGTFPLTATDGIFWMLLGVLVVLNTLRHARRGARPKPVRRSGFSARDALTVSLRTAGVFSFMCVAWSLWTSSTVGEWLSIVSSGLRDPAGLGWVVLALALAIGAGVLVPFLRSRPWKWVRPRRWGLAPAPLALGGVAVLLLLVDQPVLDRQLGARTAGVVASLRKDRLNQQDTDLLTRGYYEDLIGINTFSSPLWRVQLQKPADWQGLKNVGAVRQTRDMRSWVLLPSRVTTFKRTTLRTNRWGMRDREYDKQKPPGTYRAAIIGASPVMGSGVENDEVFESIVEDRLNREHAGGRYDRYEILNFAVGGYGLLEILGSTEATVLDFEPDAYLYVTDANELSRTTLHLIQQYRKGIAFPHAYLRDLITRAGLTPDMETREAMGRLKPFEEDLLGWGYERIVAESKARGVVPVWVFCPRLDPQQHDGERLETLTRLARAAGFTVLDMAGAYGHVDLTSLQVAPWDKHPNAEAHRLLAHRLYRLLLDNDGALGLGLKKQEVVRPPAAGRADRGQAG